MMISKPSSLNGATESTLTKQNGKAPDTTNDEEEDDDHTHTAHISSLKQKLLAHSLKRSPSADHEPAKKIKTDNADKKRRALIRLRQLENKLRNEETKYVVLKRMYFSQKSNAHRVNGQPAKAPHKPGQARPAAGKAVTPARPAPPAAATAKPAGPVHTTAASVQHKQHHRVANNSSPLLKTSASPSSAFSPVAEAASATPPAKKPNAHTHALVNQLVRKEFEKSLNQLEFPPKSVQHHQLFQDIYFLPNANSPDFLMCLGLEEVVRCVQEHLANKQQHKELKEKKELNEEDREKAHSQVEIRYEYPYVCAQCGTDWTPVWRTDRNGVVLCEKCLKLIEKRHIKQEQVAKLKQLFSKAHKDKEVFEKQVLSEQTKAAQSTPSAAPRPAHSTPVGQKMAPVSGRPAPLHSHRPSPTGPKTAAGGPRPVQQNARSVQSVPQAKSNMAKEQQQQPQRQRGSTGAANMNSYAQGSVKASATPASAGLNNLSSQFNFSNLPHAVAFAALAQHQQQQQQQQQQQAALLQLLQNQPQSSLFNLPNLSSSSNATLNYLNMLSSSAANLNGKQWKNS